MKTRVLVVDDDQSVRRSIRKVLEQEGYEVLCAADGEEAVRLSPRDVEVLILDIGLPLRSGWEVFEQLTARNPLMVTVIITGKDKQFLTAAAAGACAFMEKPIDVDAMVQTLADLLAEPREERVRRLAGRGAEPRYVAPDVRQFFEDLYARINHPFHFRPSGAKSDVKTDEP